MQQADANGELTEKQRRSMCVTGSRAEASARTALMTKYAQPHVQLTLRWCLRW